MKTPLKIITGVIAGVCLLGSAGNPALIIPAILVGLLHLLLYVDRVV